MNWVDIVVLRNPKKHLWGELIKSFVIFFPKVNEDLRFNSRAEATHADVRFN